MLTCAKLDMAIQKAPKTAGGELCQFKKELFEQNYVDGQVSCIFLSKNASTDAVYC